MEETQFDLLKICRACKNEAENMCSIFEYCQLFDEIQDSPRIDEMLMFSTSIQVKPDDGLPSVICDQCVEQLKTAFIFKKLCEQTDLSFRQYTKKLDFADIKEESQNTVSVERVFVEEFEASVSEQPPIPNEQIEKSDFIEFMENNQMILTCRVCMKYFTTLDGLRSHKRIHLGTLFKCRICGKGYTRQTHVYRHELSHGKHKVHACRICNKTITRVEHLKRHLTTHLKEKPFSCKTCNRGFNRSDHMEVHAARCKGGRMHICDICNRGFSREDSLELHKRLHGNQTPVLPTSENIDNIEEHYYEVDYDPHSDHAAFSDTEDCLEPHVDDPDPGADYKQEVPPEIMQIRIEENGSNENAMIEDELEIKGLMFLNVNEVDEKPQSINSPEDNEPDNNDDDSTTSEYCPTKTTKMKRGRGRPRKKPKAVKNSRRTRQAARERKDSSDMDDEGEFPCPGCNKVFTKMSLLEKHAKIHDGVKIHACKICNKQFSRFNYLKRHMSSHSAVRPYSCDFCSKRFCRKDHLQQHIKLHNKSQEFECDICNKQFHRADQLAKHKLSKHEPGLKMQGEKKYECNICLKTFTTEKYRELHIKGHMGEKRFKCKTCDKCFLSKSHLTEHAKFHNEHSKKFLCSECGQRFIRNDYLVIHMRRHRGEKPYKCKFCGKGFPRTTDLTVHERYHTGEKTHLCTICGRGFGRAYNLTVHMRTHTGEKPYQCTYCEAAFAQGNDLKAHVRRHTGERFQCELCTESFLMGYLLTQHKRSVHGLNVVSNIRRLQPVNKTEQDVEDPPITIPLPKPVVPDHVIQAHISAVSAQLQQDPVLRREAI